MADFDVNISDGTSVEVVVTPSSEAGAGVSDHGALTGLSDDDHTQYHTDARGDARYKPLAYVPAWTDITGKPSVFPPDAHNHDALYSPLGHNHDDSYFTETEADARYLQSVPGSYATDTEVATAISNHEAVSDPHTGYQKESEKDQNSGYAGLNSSGRVPVARLASGTPDGTKFVRDDGVLAVPAGAAAGNIGGAYDIEAGTYTDAGMSDEFASGTLNAKWTTAISSGTIDFPGQPGTARYDLTTRPGTLLLQPAYSTSAAQTTTMRQADGLALGESLVLSCALPYLARYTATAYTYIGLLLNSSTTFASGTYNQFRAIVNFASANSNAATVEMTTNAATMRAVAINTATSNRIYLRVSRKTINSIDSFVWLFSVDGIVWTLVWQSTAADFTQMWISTETNTQTNPSISPVYPVNWIRHVASTAHDLW